MTLGLSRPEVLSPPVHPPPCCTQHTITVPASVNRKTAQRHDYPGKAWRRSYARRSAAERSNARIKDPATVDITRGWCRVMGLTPMTLFVATALVVRNLAVADAFVARREDDERRAASGRPPRTRRRRRTTLAQLAGTAGTTPPWSPDVSAGTCRGPLHRAPGTARPRIACPRTPARRLPAVSHPYGRMAAARNVKRVPTET